MVIEEEKEKEKEGKRWRARFRLCTSSSRSRHRKRPDDSSDDSELSYEAPLRKKAAKKNSVMEMLVRHAPQQLAQGALLEDGGAAAG